MFRFSSEKVLSRLLVSLLYLLLLVSITDFALAMYLFAVQEVDSTMSASVVLILVSGLFSIAYIFFQSYLTSKLSRNQVVQRCRTPAQILCAFLPKILVIFWMAAAAAGLVVASHQTTCLSGTTTSNYWKIGDSCKLHRAAVGIAVFALLVACALFWTIELSNKFWQISLTGVYSQEQNRMITRLSAAFSSRSSTLLDEEDFAGSRHDSWAREKFYGLQDPDNQSRFSRASRRSGLSSRSVVYLPNAPNIYYSPPHYFSPYAPPTQYPPLKRSRSAQSIPYSQSSYSTYSSRSQSTRSSRHHQHPSISSTSGSSTSSGSRTLYVPPAHRLTRGTLAPIIDVPDVPHIPEKFKEDATVRRSSQAKWKRRSRSAPNTSRKSFLDTDFPNASLSTDPQIRALVTGKDSSERSEKRNSRSEKRNSRSEKRNSRSEKRNSLLMMMKESRSKTDLKTKDTRPTKDSEARKKRSDNTAIPSVSVIPSTRESSPTNSEEMLQTQPQQATVVHRRASASATFLLIPKPLDLSRKQAEVADKLKALDTKYPSQKHKDAANVGPAQTLQSKSHPQLSTSSSSPKGATPAPRHSRRRSYSRPHSRSLSSAFPTTPSGPPPSLQPPRPVMSSMSSGGPPASMSRRMNERDRPRSRLVHSLSTSSLTTISSVDTTFTGTPLSRTNTASTNGTALVTGATPPSRSMSKTSNSGSWLAKYRRESVVNGPPDRKMGYHGAPSNGFGSGTTQGFGHGTPLGAGIREI